MQKGIYFKKLCNCILYFQVPVKSSYLLSCNIFFLPLEMATSFIPKGQEELLLPNPLAQSYTSPDYHSKSLLYSRNVRSSLTGREADILEDGSTSHRLGFCTRHNPHPG